MTRRTRTFGALAAAGLALAGAPGAGAAVLNVNCKTGGNLQAKLNSAPGGSTIRIKGTCHGVFTITKKFTLQGNPKATLDGDDGGSVITTTKPLRLVDLKIVDGTAGNGGGIFAGAGAKLTLVRTTVSGNVAIVVGGGIAALAPVVLQHSVVNGNKVEQTAPGPTVSGGGIAANSVTLTDSTVSYNAARANGAANPTSARGGGITLLSGGLVAIRSHIDHNTARANGPSGTAIGAAILQQTAGTLRLTDSTVSRNLAVTDSPIGSSTIQGAAVYAFKVVAKRSSFIGNRGSIDSGGAATATGAIYLNGNGAFTAVRIRDTRLDVLGTTTAVGYGSAIALVPVGHRLTITNSTISGGRTTVSTTSNQAQGFGAILSFGATTVTRSTIAKNRVSVTSQNAGAAALGGGIRAVGKLTVRSSTISGNTATATVDDSQSVASGGGISLESAPGQSTITNSTVAGNTASATADPISGGSFAYAAGGGITADSTALRLVNATVAKNRLALDSVVLAAIELGAGIYSNTANVELRGTLLAANHGMGLAFDCNGPMASLGYNLVAKTTGCAGLTTKSSDKLNKNPKLGTLGTRGGPTATIPLKKGSAALNAIPKGSCKVKTDQRGMKRPQQKKCEIGAWERKAP